MESDKEDGIHKCKAELVAVEKQGPAAVLEKLITSCARIFSCEAATAFMVNEGERKVTVCCATGNCAGMLKNLSFSYAGAVGWVAENQRTLLVKNAAQDKRFFSDVDGATGFTTRVIMACPITKNGRLVAIIELLNPKGDLFVEEDQFQVECLCTAAGNLL